MQSPRGCRFTPTDYELIQYLWDKLDGCPDPGQGFIYDHLRVYDTSPHLLSPGARDGKLFCFTSIKFRKGSICRDRSTPHGHWKAKSGKRTVRDDDGNPVGYTQNFSYYIGRKMGFRTKWIMKEYTIFGDEPHNVALCVIYSSVNKYYSAKSTQKLSILRGATEVDVSQMESSQGSRSDHWIRKNCSNDLGARSGELSFVNDGGCLPAMKNEQCSPATGKYVTSTSGFPASLLEEVNSPQLDLKLQQF